MVHISDNGTITITSDDHYSHSGGVEEYHNRFVALVNILKQRNPEFNDEETTTTILDIIEDYIPSKDQLQIAFYNTDEAVDNKNQLRREVAQAKEELRLIKEKNN